MRYNLQVLTALAVSVLLFAFAATPVAHGQSVERQVLVSVLNDNGSPVGELTISDVIVREDGVLREVLSIQLDTEPKQIALLVDTSQRAGHAAGDFKRAAAAFVDAMRVGNEISIISFGGTPKILTDSTTDPTRLRDGLDRIFSYSQTASYLLDAVSETAQGFVRRASPRPVIVVLTTLGVDYSNANDQVTLDQLTDAGVPLHAIVVAGSSPLGIEIGRSRQGLAFGRPEHGLDFGLSTNQNLERDRFLAQGPHITGGLRRHLQSGASSEQALVDLAAQLRSQHLVVYSRPGMLIPPEQIEVAADRKDFEIRGVPVSVTKSN